MAQSTEDYLSIIGPAYVLPIMKLYETVEKEHKPSFNDVQTSVYENGYSSSIIMLSVILLESVIALSRYHQKSINKKDRSAVTYFVNNFQNSNLVGECEELFVIRDVIAHSHIWEAKYDSDTMDLYEARLMPVFFGDNKYDKVINQSNRLSEKLRLNMFPTRINFSDATIVLRTVGQIIDYIQDWHKNQPQSALIMRPGILRVRRKGQWVMFTEFTRSL
jgi:hypothetical protein